MVTFNIQTEHLQNSRLRVKGFLKTIVIQIKVLLKGTFVAMAVVIVVDSVAAVDTVVPVDTVVVAAVDILDTLGTPAIKVEGNTNTMQINPNLRKHRNLGEFLDPSKDFQDED